MFAVIGSAQVVKKIQGGWWIYHGYEICTDNSTENHALLLYILIIHYFYSADEQYTQLTTAMNTC